MIGPRGGGDLMSGPRGAGGSLMSSPRKVGRV